MKGNNINTWNTIGRSTIHIQDMEDQSLFGKAICGTRFGHSASPAESKEGTRVSCARCLVKIGWAKKVGSKKLENETVGVQRSIGYSETYYELVKVLRNAHLRIDHVGKSGDWEVGTFFYTNTDNGL